MFWQFLDNLINLIGQPNCLIGNHDASGYNKMNQVSHFDVRFNLKVSKKVGWYAAHN